LRTPDLNLLFRSFPRAFTQTDFSDKNGTASAQKIEMMMTIPLRNYLCCEMNTIVVARRCGDAFSNAFRYRLEIVMVL